MSMSTAPHELYAQWNRLPSERQFIVGALIGLTLLLLAPYLPLSGLKRGSEGVPEVLAADTAADKFGGEASGGESLFMRAGATVRALGTQEGTPDLREIEKLLN